MTALERFFVSYCNQRIDAIFLGLEIVGVMKKKCRDVKFFEKIVRSFLVICNLYKKRIKKLTLKFIAYAPNLRSVETGCCGIVSQLTTGGLAACLCVGSG